MHVSRILALTFGLAEATGSDATTNALDPAFGTSGVVLLGTTPVMGQRIVLTAGLAVQADGKIILAGMTDGPNSNPIFTPAVGRLNSDGSWDESFGNHGLFAFPTDADAVNGGEANQIVVLQDNSLVIAGGTFRTSFDPHDFHSCTLLFKLDATGAIVSTFGGNGTGGRCFDFVPGAPDEGAYSHFDGLQAGPAETIYLTAVSDGGAAVARFDVDGGLDASFGSEGIASMTAGGVAWVGPLRQANESVVAVGTRRTQPSYWDLAVTRFDAAGQPDTTYGSSSESDIDMLDGPFVGPNDAELDAQNRVVIAVQDSGGGAESWGYRFVRLAPSGAADITFNGAGQQAGFPGVAKLPMNSHENDAVVAAKPLSDGHLFAVGIVGSLVNGGNLFGVVRLAEDAAFDAGFGDASHPGWTTLDIAGGNSPFNTPYAMVMDPYERALVAMHVSGTIAGNCTGLMRFLPDQLFGGSFDATIAFPVCPP